MKKIFVLAMVAILSAGSVSKTYAQQDPGCKKECDKKCKKECTQKCDDKTSCDKQTSKA